MRRVGGKVIRFQHTESKIVSFSNKLWTTSHLLSLHFCYALSLSVLLQMFLQMWSLFMPRGSWWHLKVSTQNEQFTAVGKDHSVSGSRQCLRCGATFATLQFLKMISSWREIAHLSPALKLSPFALHSLSSNHFSHCFLPSASVTAAFLTFSTCSSDSKRVWQAHGNVLQGLHNIYEVL